MDGVWGQLVLVAVLVVINAAFAGSELALVTLRDSQLAQLEERGGAGAVLARLAREPNQFFATIQIGITLAGFLASATAAVSLAEPLVEPLSGVIGGAAGPVSIIVVTLALTFVTLVFGELAPKRLAMQRAERWGLLAARPLTIIGGVARPAVWLLARTTDLVVQLLGGDPSHQRDDVSEDELRHMVATQPELSEQERHIIDGAFEFADRTIRQILVPRTSVVALDVRTTVGEAARVLARTGHTRAPVHDGGLDHLVGTVHLRALVEASGTVGDHSQPPLVLPETSGCLAALRTMQAERQQMAAVIDEHGGMQGIVTIEDLVEELVGEIYDEADPDVQAVRRDDAGGLTVVGSYPVHDLPDIGVDLPAGSYTTVAGLVLAALGRMPVVGDRVDIGGWTLAVTGASERTIDEVRIEAAEQPGDPQD